VQGGKCIAHGAKKKLCSMEDCKKQAILGGMCKQHHDKMNGVPTARGRNPQNESLPKACIPVPSTENDTQKEHPSCQSHRPGHTRGLSLFQELSADAVQNLLSDEQAGPNVGPISEGRPEVETSGSGQHRNSTGSYSTGATYIYM